MSGINLEHEVPAMVANNRPPLKVRILEAHKVNISGANLKVYEAFSRALAAGDQTCEFEEMEQPHNWLSMQPTGA